MELKEALAKLDPENNEHWTGNGDAKLEVLKEMTGEQVSRQDVVEAAPQFNRSHPTLEIDDPFADDDEDEKNTDPGEGTVDPLVASPDTPPEVNEENFMSVEEAGKVVDEYLEGEPLDPRGYYALLGRMPNEELGHMEEVLEEQLLQAEMARVAADELYKMVKYGLGLTRATIKSRVPDVDNQTAIRHYIAKSNQTRGGKIERANELKKLVKAKDLDPRAPIDRAMARKTARGGQRPNRGNLNR